MYNHTTNLLAVQAIVLQRKAELEHDQEPARYRVERADKTRLLQPAAALMGNLMVRSGKAMERYAQPTPKCNFEDNCV